MNRKAILFLMVIAVLAGIAIRVAHYKLDLYNSDEAIVGVMGMHILRGEDFPAFNYGISYIGSLEAYLAALMFKLFGISVLSHHLVLILFTIIYCFAMYSLSARLFESRKVGLLALSFALVCPSFLGFWNLEAIGGYMESLAFGTLIFILVHQIVWRNEKRVVFFLMLGLLVGIAWWTGGFVVYYVLTAAVFLFLKDKIFFLRRNFLVLITGFFVGSLPYWIYQFGTGFESMSFYGSRQGSFSLDVLTGFIKFGLPNVLSIGPYDIWSRPILPRGPLCKLSFLVEIIFFAALLGLIWRYRKGFFSMMKLSVRGTKGPELIFCFTVIVALIYLFSKYSSPRGIRVVLPLYTAIPMLFAFLVASIWRRTRLAAYFVAGIVFFFALYGNYCFSVDALRQGGKRKDRWGAPRVEGLVRRFMDIGIKRCYAAETLHFKITFASRGRIISIPACEGRYPLYEETLNAGSNPAYLFRTGEAGRFVKPLKSLCGSFDMERYGKFVIFRNFKRPDENLIELSPKIWKAGASKNSGCAVFAYDRNISTRWSSGRSQKAGEYFELDLGRVDKLRKLIIITDSFEKRNRLMGVQFPLGFDLELSTDGEEWKEIFHLPEYGAVGSLFWSGCRPFWKAFDGRMELFLPEAEEARYVRLTLTSDHSVHRWTINEIFAYSAGEGGDEGDSHQDVLEFLMRRRIGKIYAGYWLSSWIHSASGKKIEHIPAYNRYRTMYPGGENPDRIVDFGEDIALVVERENAALLEEVLNLSGITRSREEIGKYLIYYSLRRESHNEDVRLGTDGWAAVTNSPGMDARNTFDGNLDNRWGTGTAQRPGMFYRLDLGRSYVLKRVNFSLGRFRRDYPRGYRVEVSVDGKRWEKLEEEDRWRGEFFWSGTHLLKYHEPGIDFRCKPTSARFIRVSLTGYDDRFDWSVAETAVWVGSRRL